MKLTLTHEGLDYISYTPGELAEAGVPQEAISAAQTATVAQDGQQARLKAALSAAGGVEAVLVDTLDLTTVALSGLVRLAQAISNATTIADIRAAAVPVSTGLAAWPDDVQVPLDAASDVQTALRAAATRAAAITAAYEAE